MVDEDAATNISNSNNQNEDLNNDSSAVDSSRADKQNEGESSYKRPINVIFKLVDDFSLIVQGKKED